jgi:hypothetical protein
MCAILLLAGVGGASYPCLQSGRLPQIIGIGKCYAWLLLIGGVMCAILLLAGVGGASDPCLQSGVGYHRSSELVSFLHGCL